MEKKSIFAALIAALVPMVLCVSGGYACGMYINYAVAVVAVSFGVYLARREDEAGATLVSGLASSMVALIYLIVSDFFVASWVSTAFAVAYASLFWRFFWYAYRYEVSKTRYKIVSTGLDIVRDASAISALWLLIGDHVWYLLLGFTIGFIVGGYSLNKKKYNSVSGPS
ncbi:MAG: hypothetical protein J6N49_02320 [Alphaproteobacteria bacterium]|nr:hypothetical protein [Alphaproteobacteria bacterium]